MACSGAALAADDAKDKVPNFAPTDMTGWVLDRRAVDDLLAPPEGGPGPITWDKTHPYIPNGTGKQPTYRVADLSNPILQPWAREAMKKSNDEVIAGKVPFRARERCWPIGVPGFDIYSLVEPFYFYQTEKEITVVNQGGPEVRHIYMNVPHSANPKPSWYGESVGHYENGDTLVIDTIGLNAKTFIDNYRTPHTDKLHVVERFRMIDGGKTMEVTLHVEDEGAFTSPWDAVQRYRRIGAGGDAKDPRVPRNGLEEMACAENNGDILNEGLEPIPEADTPDF
jgi:hypothetical protein